MLMTATRAALCDWRIGLFGDETTLFLMEASLRSPGLRVYREGDRFFLSRAALNRIHRPHDLINPTDELLRFLPVERLAPGDAGEDAGERAMRRERDAPPRVLL